MVVIVILLSSTILLLLLIRLLNNMPIYEFRCENKLCTEYNKVVEKVKSIKDNSAEKCLCGRSMKKDVSLSSFNLKGDGWFRSGFPK